MGAFLFTSFVEEDVLDLHSVSPSQSLIQTHIHCLLMRPFSNLAAADIGCFHRDITLRRNFNGMAEKFDIKHVEPDLLEEFRPRERALRSNRSKL
ncbi:hypothetical protein [Bradyrhizobium neotropicale]|uniref:hypothetical protein n=1 Tax=Bradyrhizobium neotropicale TaxID=1497615 RepID=UPI001AD6FD9A|nr:hypothetical protein [Bradyrhizobium neotropicale]MBO4228538.1 hypothetical protein [Bradyrhizobium neotropicale]